MLHLALNRRALRDVPRAERPLGEHHQPERQKPERGQHDDDGEGEVHAQIAGGDPDVVAARPDPRRQNIDAGTGGSVCASAED